MLAGAAALAAHDRRPTGPRILEDVVAKALETQERMEVLRRWTRDGKVVMSTTAESIPQTDPWQHRIEVYGKKEADGRRSHVETVYADHDGKFPTALTLAQVALALQAYGEL
jgi:hypothetical protein